MPEQNYMQLALDLAAQAVGRTAPNPAVGAVVVADGKIVGRGFHPAAGQPHAEIFALEDAGSRAKGADLYVTLEPCNHQGQTGPCTEAIISAAIKRVFVGTIDPNPFVAGKGIEKLRSAGIEVSIGFLEKPCRRLIAPFAKHVTTGLPYVTLKMAMTLDGQTATSTGDSKWISNAASRQHVHTMRDQSDAIMVGVGTILADDPQLTTRLEKDGKDPTRIVVDSHLRVPVSAKILSLSSTAPTILVTTDTADRERIDQLSRSGIEVVVAPSVDGRVDLKILMEMLGARGVQSILLEGGATLAAEALKSGIVDHVALFVAPKLLGGSDGRSLLSGRGCRFMTDAIRLSDIRLQQFDDDILIEGEIS